MISPGLRQADYLSHMRGMRNRLAHGYFDINLDIVWDTVKQALPELEGQLRQVQKSLQ